MPHQLIYTSSPRGVVAGRSGYCTVARSAQMREALLLQLEKFCYYQHLSLMGGRERPIFTCRLVDIRGARYHVLSRIQDAGLDFTGRTNFIAHHLAFAPEEIRSYPPPPVILRGWTGWATSWTKEPQLLADEDWTELAALAAQTPVAAHTWRQVTGNAVNAYGLLEARPGATFQVDDLADETVLNLFAESLALLEIREARRDFRLTAWSHTFTTSLQEQDNPADFRWRCLHADNPAAGRLATPGGQPLSAVRAGKCSAEETAFASTGRQAPVFAAGPANLEITEGEMARFTARAEGVPRPVYQWYSVDRAGRRTVLPGETNPELVIAGPVMGVSRYAVSAANQAGAAESLVATLEVKLRVKEPRVRVDGGDPAPAREVVYKVKSAEELDNLWQQHKLEKEREGKQKRWLQSLILAAMLLVVGGGVFAWIKVHDQTAPKPPAPQKAGTNNVSPPAASVSTNEASPPGPANPPVEEVKTAELPPLMQEAVPLSAPWTAANVGLSGKPAAPAYDHGEFIMTTGMGETLPGQANDHCLLVSRPWSGPVDEFTAHFFMSDKIGKSLCGLMLRESSRDDAPFVFIGASETHVVLSKREAAGAIRTQISYKDTNNPLYLRLVHQGNYFFGEFLDNGQWLTLDLNGQISLSSSNYLIGFAIWPAEKSVHAHFDHVTINGIKQ